MQKSLRRSLGRKIWGMFGCLIAAGIIFGISVWVRCRELTIVEQWKAIGNLVLMTVAFATLWLNTDRRRCTHHQNARGETWYVQDVGFWEQKFYQLMIISLTAVIVILVDIKLDFLTPLMNTWIWTLYSMGW